MKILFQYFLLILTVFFTLSKCQAQNVSLYDIDTKNFPIVKAKVLAFDNNNKREIIQKNEIKVTENGTERTVTDVKCPTPAEKSTCSVTMSFDVSGSMTMKNSMVASPIELAKLTVLTMLPAVVKQNTELAVQTCNDVPLLLQDFTSNIDRVQRSVSLINAKGSDNYSAQLMHQLAGAVTIAKKGIFNRSIVVFTDAFAQDIPVDVVKKILDTCSYYKIRFITVEYSNAYRDNSALARTLRDICIKTGGHYIEEITSPLKAQSAALLLRDLAYGDEPCEITWTSGYFCNRDVAKVICSKGNFRDTVEYEPPITSLATINFYPKIISFGEQIPGGSYDLTLSLTAYNTDYTISGILLSNQQVFSLHDVTFPFTIRKNETKTITVRFTPPNAAFHYIVCEVQTDVCPLYFSCMGGIAGNTITDPNLRVVAPNGGEIIGVGSNPKIQWNGISPNDLVSIDVSTDNGLSWAVVSGTSSGLQHTWKNMPKVKSEQCKIRVQHIADKITDIGTTELILAAHDGSVNHATWSPDGSLIASCGADGSIIIWDAKNGKIIHKILAHSASVSILKWSPDGSSIASAGDDNVVKVWNPQTGKLIADMIGHTSWIGSLDWSPDGSRLASCGGDKTIKIWDAVVGVLINTLTGHTEQITSVHYSPDGTKLLSSSWDYSAKIWDANTGMILRNLDHNSWVISASWSPDARKVATSVFNRTASIWDVSTSAKLHSLSGHTAEVRYISWSPDGKSVATASSDRTARIWNAETGVLSFVLTGHNYDVNQIEWNPKGNRIATSSEDQTIKIYDVKTGSPLRTFIGHQAKITHIEWSNDHRRLLSASADNTVRTWFVDDNLSIGKPIQTDMSDSIFTIDIPTVEGRSIDMKQCLFGKSKDSIIRAALVNTSKLPVRIDDIIFSGKDALAFTYVSPQLPTIINPNESMDYEIRFTPSFIGIHSATMYILTQSDTLMYDISGEGIAGVLNITHNTIDFGKVGLGDSRDTLVGITNIGKAPVEITLNNGGPNIKDFNFEPNQSTVTLFPADTLWLRVRFTPKEIGRMNGSIEIENTFQGVKYSIILFGEGIFNDEYLSVDKIIVDFGKVPIGKKVRELCSITNVGMEPVTFSLSHNKVNPQIFSVNETTQGMILMPGQRYIMSIDFTPTEEKIYYDTVLLNNLVSNREMIIQLKGEGVKNIDIPDTVRATIAVNSIQAQIGENVKVCLYIKQKENFTDRTPKKFRAQFECNSTVLFINQPGLLCESPQEYVCRMTIEGERGESDTLVSVNAIATLGTVENSPINLVSFVWTDTTTVVKETRTQDGSIAIINVCKEGSTRLFIPSGESQKLISKPNPVTNNFMIEYGLAEPTRATLDLIDIEGRVVERFFDDILHAAGSYIHYADAQQFGAGKYLLRLKTQTTTMIRHIEILQ